MDFPHSRENFINCALVAYTHFVIMMSAQLDYVGITFVRYLELAFDNGFAASGPYAKCLSPIISYKETFFFTKKRKVFE
jgi:hypothetical protein